MDIKMVQIGVIGSGMEISEEIYQLAEQVGEELARNKVILICGGKGGVMEAVCKGAQKFAGITVGILPSDNPAEANQFVTIKIPTKLGEKRNNIIIQSVQAAICVSGSVGTRIEAEYALKRKVPLITIPQSGGTAQELTEEFPDRVIQAHNAVDAVQKALQSIRPKFNDW